MNPLPYTLPEIETPIIDLVMPIHEGIMTKLRPAFCRIQSAIYREWHYATWTPPSLAEARSGKIGAVIAESLTQPKLELYADKHGAILMYAGWPENFGDTFPTDFSENLKHLVGVRIVKMLDAEKVTKTHLRAARKN